jgi:hypothetical protein
MIPLGRGYQVKRSCGQFAIVRRAGKPSLAVVGAGAIPSPEQGINGLGSVGMRFGQGQGTSTNLGDFVTFASFCLKSVCAERDKLCRVQDHVKPLAP